MKTTVGVCATAAVRVSAQGRAPGDLASLSILEAGELLRTRKVSPVELTNACLARIDRLNPALTNPRYLEAMHRIQDREGVAFL